MNKIIIYSNQNQNKELDITNNPQKIPKGLKIIFKDNCHNSIIKFSETSKFCNTLIVIHNSGSKVHIGEETNFNNLLIDLSSGATQQLIVGNYSTFFGGEIILRDTSKLIIGENCLFDKGLKIYTTDFHTIYDNSTRKVLNETPELLHIGNHVWVGTEALILKKGSIGDNSVVAGRAIVTENFSNEQNIILAGNPAKIIKKNICWDRDTIPNFKIKEERKINNGQSIEKLTNVTTSIISTNKKDSKSNASIKTDINIPTNHISNPNTYNAEAKVQKIRIAELFFKNKDFISALSCFRDIKANFPYDYNIDFRIIDTYVALNDLNTALEYLNSMKIESNNADKVEKFNYRSDIIRTQLSNIFQINIQTLSNKINLLSPASQFKSNAANLLKTTIKFDSVEQIDFIIEGDDSNQTSINPKTLTTPKKEQVENNIFIYSTTINLLKTKKVGIVKNNNLKDIIWIIRVSMQKTFKVLKGQENWLFLDNDTNSSPDQFKGHSIITIPELDKWKEYFNHLSTANKTILLIPPSKEQVYPQFYPFKRGEVCPIDQLLSLTKNYNNKIKLIYPLKELKQINNSYSKTDTHWSALGAIKVIYNLVNYEFNTSIKTTDSKLTISPLNNIGDLGSKCQPYESSEFFLVEKTTLGKIDFSNFHENQGSIIKIYNPDSMLNKTIIIFGDSFSSIVKPIFNEIFRKTIIIRSNATIIKDIINFEKPDLILCEITERFIINAPRVYSHIIEYSPCIRTDITENTKKQLNNICITPSQEPLYSDYVSYYQKILGEST